MYMLARAWRIKVDSVCAMAWAGPPESMVAAAG